jgi:type IV secretory pathway TrbD component
LANFDELDERPITTKVRVSLLKNDLVLGCERLPFVITFVMAFACIVIFQKPLTMIFGFLIIFAGIPLLQQMAKRDPLMLSVLIRHLLVERIGMQPTPSVRRPPVTPMVNIR